KLLIGPHIDKVLFAATKADHVPDIQRDHLAALLRNMAAFPALEVRSSNAQLDVTALASVISTAEDTQEIDGQRLQVVVGRPVGSKTQSKFFVGNVPIRPPRADAWARPSSMCRCSSRPPSIPRRSRGLPTSTSTWRSNFCLETGCDERSNRPWRSADGARDRGRGGGRGCAAPTVGAPGDPDRAHRARHAERAGAGRGGRA